MTQFGRALAELNNELICTESNQTKGRVERANRTLQDRLIKGFRPAGISDIESGNNFHEQFTTRFNERFAVAPGLSENPHRPLLVTPDRLQDILCHREQRRVSQQLALSYGRKRLILMWTEFAEGMVDQYVAIYDVSDKRVEIRWKDV